MIEDPLTGERSELERDVAGRTLVDLLAKNAVVFPDREAVRWQQGGEWRSMDWAELRVRALDTAAGLIAKGVEQGDRVAIMAGNRPEHVIADLGIVHAGATPITVYGTMSDEHLRHVVADAGLRLAFADAAGTDRLAGVISDVIGFDSDAWSSFVDRGAELHRADPERVERRAAEVTPSSTATLIYTSGTTGEPKGVVLSHRTVLWTLASMERAIELPEHPQFVSYLPLAHIAERMATHYFALWLVGSVAYCANIAAVMQTVKAVRPHLFVGVPRIWEQIHRRVAAKLDQATGLRRRLVEAARSGGGGRVVDSVLDRTLRPGVRAELGLDRAVMAITTAGPIDAAIIADLRAVGVPLYELFGMTECCGPATANVPGHDRIGTVGRALPGVEVRTAADGELLIRGGNIADGYHGRTEPFTHEGWLATGDLAEIDADGYVTIAGRKKDIIVSAGGKNIAPVPIEQRLLRHDLIAQACVVGDRKPHLAALVVIDREVARVRLGTDDVTGPEVRAAVSDILEEVNRDLGKVERVKGFAVVGEEWTPENGLLTPSLKLRRMAVNERYSDLIGGL